MVKRLKSALLGLSPKEALFSRRGFPACDPDTRGHLERIIRTFIEGYNLAVVVTKPGQLSERLEAGFPPALVGFAYEGAGLYFALADLLVPRSESRLGAFTSSAARHHDYIVTVGAGFALARVPFGLSRLASYQKRLDPMSAWCLADGYGFHQGFFRWRRYIGERQPIPRSLDPQSRRLFDAGLGRSMWWVFGADPALIAAAIARFDADRQPEMWTGIGTAVAYAGGGPAEARSVLLKLAGPHRCDLLSGIPFAAHMRHKGGNFAECTEQVCSELLKMSAAEASDMILSELTSYLDGWHGAESEKWSQCYLVLRKRVKERLAVQQQPDLVHSFVEATTGLGRN